MRTFLGNTERKMSHKSTYSAVQCFSPHSRVTRQPLTQVRYTLNLHSGAYLEHSYSNESVPPQSYGESMHVECAHPRRGSLSN